MGAGFHIYIGVEKVPKNYFELKQTDMELARRFFRACIDMGLYFHTDFTISASHDRETLAEALNKIESVLNTFTS